jgi:hypothetical protein
VTFITGQVAAAQLAPLEGLPCLRSLTLSACPRAEEGGQRCLAAFPDTLLRLRGLTALSLSSKGGWRRRAAAGGRSPLPAASGGEGRALQAVRLLLLELLLPAAHCAAWRRSNPPLQASPLCPRASPGSSTWPAWMRRAATSTSCPPTSGASPGCAACASTPPTSWWHSARRGRRWGSCRGWRPWSCGEAAAPARLALVWVVEGGWHPVWRLALHWFCLWRAAAACVAGRVDLLGFAWLAVVGRGGARCCGAGQRSQHRKPQGRGESSCLHLWSWRLCLPPQGQQGRDAARPPPRPVQPDQPGPQQQPV